MINVNECLREDIAKVIALHEGKPAKEIAAWVEAKLEDIGLLDYDTLKEIYLYPEKEE